MESNIKLTLSSNLLEANSVFSQLSAYLHGSIRANPGGVVDASLKRSIGDQIKGFAGVWNAEASVQVPVADSRALLLEVIGLKRLLEQMAVVLFAVIGERLTIQVVYAFRVTVCVVSTA